MDRERVLAAFTAESRRLARVTTGLDEDAWSRPTGCEPWTAAELFAHVFTAVTRVSGMLAEPEPHPASEPGAEVGLISAAQYYRPDERFSADTNAARIESARAQAGQCGGPALAARFGQAAAEVAAQCAGQDAARVVRTRHGDAMLLTDFLVTRVVELAVHGLDLAAALGRPAWMSDEAADVLCELMAGPRGVEAVREAGWEPVEVLAKATGRAPMSDEERRRAEAVGVTWLSLG